MQSVVQGSKCFPYDKGIMETVSEKRFPVNANDYKLYEEVGEGVSATVYRALCIPLNEIVAIKVLNLEKCNNDLDGIRREVQTMTLIYHTNVLQAHCSFTTGHNLWVVMPYMAGGSCLHIMKSAYPEGFEEPVIATVLREVLKALVYLHAHGHIHRDVKAGNILVDFNGSVKLADFGVSACMFDAGDRLRSRNTFVGTPCWMAPEVMQQLHGYDFKADIWSLGITALELAHGHAPFSKYPPMKVLLMTLQNAPPGLDYERDKRFSKSFKEMVALCLVKDPKKRPTSEKLLKHPFFKHGRQNDYIARTILDGLAPLGDRFKMLKAKEAELLVQNKAMYEDKEQLSQQEYIRGISAWNFNLEDLKNQAALIQDVDVACAEDPDIGKMQQEKNDSSGFHVERSYIEKMKHLNPRPSQEDEFNELHDLSSSLASMPAKPLEALRGCFDICDDDIKAIIPRALDQENGSEDECSGQNSSSRHDMLEQKKYISDTLLPDRAISSKRVTNVGDRDNLQSKHLSQRNYSGSSLYPQRRDMTSHLSVEDLSEGAIVQHKGRFKVTSADHSPKGPTLGSLNAASGFNPTIPNLTAAAVFPSLQSILQKHTMQREEIMKLIKYLEHVSGKNAEPVETSTSNLSQISSSSARERVLNSQLLYLQQRVDSLYEELERQKSKNVQLERELNALVPSKEEKL